MGRSNPFFQGISYRLAKVGVILAFVIGFAMSSVQLYLDFQSQESQLDQLIAQVVEVAAPPATRAVHTLDDDLSAEVVNGMLAYDFIFDVAILDELGNILAQGQKARQKMPADWLTQHFIQGSKSYSARLILPGYDEIGNPSAVFLGAAAGNVSQSGPVAAAQGASPQSTWAKSGVITFKVDLNTVLGTFYQRSTLVILSGMLRNVLLVLLLFVAFFYLLANPLIQMAREFREIRLDRPGAKRITVPHPERMDELALLARSSNQMLDAIEETFSKRLEVEKALRDSEESIRLIINELPAMVGVRHTDGCIEFANQNMAEFFGHTTDTIPGTNVLNFGLGAGHSINRYRVLEGQPNFKNEVAGEFEGYSRDAQGDLRYLQGHMKPIVMQGETFVLMVANDITARKEAEEKMEHMAYHDALTNLPNRVHLVERLEHEILRARRHHYCGAVLFIDLDHFKNINDSLGHPVGDQVLKQVAARLRNAVRKEDLVARLSGDEFVVVLTVLGDDLDSAGLKAGEIADHIRKQISEPYPYHDIKLHVSCSVGIVVYSDSENSVHELLRFADTAMYQVKAQGRNAIEFFNLGMADKVSHQLKLESELHKALDECQFELYFQPKIELSSGHIMGAEALLRWNHPERGLVSPGEFIPVLEGSGLMIDVGQWVIEEGCRTLQQLDQMGGWQAGMQLSLNVSSRQFRGQHFVDTVTRILEEYPIPANSLDLEITESVIIQSIEDTIATMSTLSSMGISFSLDDFGTGYSSISYLKRLPVSTLKIDYSFIRDIVEDRNDRVLAETIVTMGQLLDLSVVAEGVEEKSQLDILAAFGCDYYQGFYFSKPVPLAQFHALLEVRQPVALEV
ncbi:EAL domain-containing protein [Aestuariicella hydrocarbonica]|uniref:EAL domain-containing protein n=1 Tax=Pseudomaricurvus hydrocarbonicus TaxID=1470433 RepID=A0A9E5MMP8_9GAMM|nr:EAL domain-containing protein [Aestuariicella hydrocarbonica]NHO67073.1 EAL domain-containing protein [Aestuariicella hydrocarbonica]